MKKAGIVILSLFLVLIIGQAAFAKNSLSLTVGGLGITDFNEIIVGFEGEVSANIYLTNNFSLSAGASIHAFKPDSAFLYQLGIDFFAKYDVFKTNTVDFGLQLGLINNKPLGAALNCLFLAGGLYTNIYVTPKVNLYADLKLPFGVFVLEYSSFFKLFFYNVKFGAAFEISPKIDLGIECNVNNTSAFVFASPKLFEFTVGAKLGYKF